jgi:guanine deaminase
MKTKILRGQALSFKADPFIVGDQASIHYESDGLIFLQDGKVTDFGSYESLKDKIPEGSEVKVYKDSLIIPGFVDTHVHYPQTQIIGAYGKQLIDWLNNYTFIAEQQFADYSHAEKVAKVFVQESLRAGTTTSAVFCTVHPHSVDAIFEEAQKINLRMVAGKVLMDRNAPAALTDTAQSAYDDSKALIKKWHGKGRLSYAVTPRFAPTSSPEQLELAGALWKESPGTYMHTHISENKGEIAWVKDLFPERSNYLDVYDHYGLVGERSLLAHGVHLTEEEFTRIHKTGACVCHCSTSNEFLGSGLFPFERAKDKKRPVRVGLGTDIGAGTSFSHLQTMNESYKIAQLQGYSLSSACAFYLATKGGANSLYLDDKIGSIAPGMEADLVVLDLKSTPLMDFRMSYCKDIHEVLFILMTLGDDRATKAVYVAGEKVYGE